MLGMWDVYAAGKPGPGPARHACPHPLSVSVNSLPPSPCFLFISPSRRPSHPSRSSHSLKPVSVISLSHALRPSPSQLPPTAGPKSSGRACLHVPSP